MREKAVFQSLSEVESCIEVTHSTTIFTNGIRKTWVPNAPYKKLKSGLELNKKLSTITHMTVRGSSENKEENAARNARRAKKEVLEILENNEFDMWGTITVSPQKLNRYDHQAVKSVLMSVLKAQRRKCKEFSYVIITELCKDGAIHFHGLFNKTPDIIPAMSPKYEGQMKEMRGGKWVLLYNVPAFANTLGYTKFEEVGSPDAVNHYVTKYITKDMPTFADKKRYWASRNLKRPIKVDNDPEFVVDAPPAVEPYPNDYGKLYTYSTA